ncbi:MAG TPA: 50S ribosomal protein L35 [Candidatus Polarisedimenticolia bacterium]|jgi:large subunit ribosomal protein L35|nr:50S ribosomal protein L35 [Candidatus Polarisedimenticolia bacterium]
MPKQKTHRGAAKRFRMTAGGKAKRSQAFKRHILTKKPRKRKRHLDQEVVVSPADIRRIRRMLPYG